MSSTDGNTVPVCVIAAVVVEHACIRQLTIDFLNLKQRFFPGASSGERYLDWVKAEIKGADLRRALRKTSGRRHRRQVIGFLDAFVELLERYDVDLVGRVWIKEIGGPCNGPALYNSSVQAIASYLQHLLEARDSYGYVIADSRTPALNADVSHSIFTQKHRAPGDNLPLVLEVPTFGHSENHVGLQIADLLCSALLFPMATYAYCRGAVRNVHVDEGFGQLTARYGERLAALQYRYREQGKPRGGITVNDRIGRRSGRELFHAPVVSVSGPTAARSRGRPGP